MEQRPDSRRRSQPEPAGSSGRFDEEPVDADSGVAEEDLLAFLDDEADAETQRRVESQLSRDPELRQRAEAMESTYQLLDFLPMPETAPDFTRRTATLAVSARTPSPSDDATIPYQPASQSLVIRSYQSMARRWPWVWLSGAMVCIALGFYLGRTALLQKRTLPAEPELLLHLPDYQRVGSVEFLQAFVQSAPLTGIDTSPAASGSPAATNGNGSGSESRRD